MLVTTSHFVTVEAAIDDKIVTVGSSTCTDVTVEIFVGNGGVVLVTVTVDGGRVLVE